MSAVPRLFYDPASDGGVHPLPTPPGNPLSSSSAATFTPSDDNFLLNSHYLHRLVHHLTTTAASESDPRSTPAPRSSIESLQEVSITSNSDPTLLCPVCKDPFLVNSVSKMMTYKHAYPADCIIPWLEINTLRHIARRHRWDEELNIGSGSEGNLFSPTQIGDVGSGDGVLEREEIEDEEDLFEAIDNSNIFGEGQQCGDGVVEVSGG